jgi:hypothetical protein
MCTYYGVNIPEIHGTDVHNIFGSATASAVSRGLPTAAVWICGGQSDTGTGILRVLRFPLPILILPTAPHSSSSGAGTIGQSVADVPVSPRPKKLKKA